MATLVKTTGERSEQKPENGMYFSLAELYALIGDDVEIVYLRSVEYPIMVVHGDGHRLGLPLNQTGTELYKAAPIVGDILLCKRSEIN